MAASSQVVARHRRFRLPFSPWHLVLIPATILLIFPFVWLVVTSVETPAEALHFPPVLIPRELHLANYPNAYPASEHSTRLLSTVVTATTVLLMKNRPKGAAASAFG